LQQGCGGGGSANADKHYSIDRAADCPGAARPSDNALMFLPKGSEGNLAFDLDEEDEIMLAFAKDNREAKNLRTEFKMMVGTLGMAFDVDEDEIADVDFDEFVKISGNVAYWPTGDSLTSDMQKRVQSCLGQSAS
jgi:hypothetical protein